MPQQPPPICMTDFTLNNGETIPAVGLGTWQGQYGTQETEELKESIIYALKTGYRLIDTAQFYGVESVVGEAIRASGIPRSKIKVMTKFWPKDSHEPTKALDYSLQELGTEYIDLFLLHWPCTMTPEGEPMPYPGDPPYWEAWKRMEKLVGPRCRSLGVSNFTQKTLAPLLEHASIVPTVNQIELHARNPNHNLVQYCRGKDIRPISWSTIGGSDRVDSATNPVLTHEIFTNIAHSHGCNPAVVSLSWSVQKGIPVIPKSSKRHRLDENIRLVTLSTKEMKAVDEAYKTIGRLRLSNITPGLLRYHDYLNGKETVLGWTDEEFGWEDSEGRWLC
ncbi:hypothetical protein KC315_g1729 [Hortaea werneckii]|nr:hypothetical protein KC315_g1729 [Hortaea werneckii]